MASRLLAVLLVAALLAGCATPRDPATSPTTPATTGTQTASAAAPGAASATPTTPAVRAVTLYLTADGRLDTTLPAAGGLPISSAQVVSFEGSPSTMPVQVAKDVRVTLWVQADLPMPSNQQFDVGFWFGATRATPLFILAKLPVPVVAPGTPVRLDLTLPFGTLAPLVLAGGDAFEAMALVNGDYGAATSRLLVGGEHASQLNLTIEGLAADPLAAAEPPTPEAHEGTLLATGGASPSCVFPGNMFTAPIKARANLTYIEAHAEGSGAGGADIDMAILDGERVLSAGVTPRGKESAFLAGPAAKEFSGKELTLRVTACSGGQVAFKATVRQA